MPAWKRGALGSWAALVGQAPPFSAALVAKLEPGVAGGPDSGAEKGVSDGAGFIGAADGRGAQGAAGAAEDVELQVFEGQLGVFEEAGGDLAGHRVGFEAARQLDR